MRYRLYVAYGSILLLRQMRYRCPTARLYGTGQIKDYELQFKGDPKSAFATIAPKEGSCVPAAVWEIQPMDELCLDRYEGYPSHYFKQNIPVQIDGEKMNAMVYIMNLKMDFGLPSLHYYQTVLKGYQDCKLDIDILHRAVGDSAKQYYSSAVQRFSQENLFHGCDKDFETEKIEGGKDDVVDESDPFYYFM